MNVSSGEYRIWIAPCNNTFELPCLTSYLDCCAWSNAALSRTVISCAWLQWLRILFERCGGCCALMNAILSWTSTCYILLGKRNHINRKVHRCFLYFVDAKSNEQALTVELIACRKHRSRKTGFRTTPVPRNFGWRAWEGASACASTDFLNIAVILWLSFHAYFRTRALAKMKSPKTQVVYRAQAFFMCFTKEVRAKSAAFNSYFRSCECDSV